MTINGLSGRSIDVFWKSIDTHEDVEEAVTDIPL